MKQRKSCTQTITHNNLAFRFVVQQTLKSQIFHRNQQYENGLHAKFTTSSAQAWSHEVLSLYQPHGKFVSRDDLALLIVKMNSKTDPLLNGRNEPFSSNPYFTFKYVKQEYLEQQKQAILSKWVKTCLKWSKVFKWQT